MKIGKKISFLCFIALSFMASSSVAQTKSATPVYTHADTLRGTYGPGRDWWDALHYDINTQFNLAGKNIDGYCGIQFKVLKKGTVMQLDLQKPLTLDSVIIPTKHLALSFKKDGNAYFIDVPALETGKIYTLNAYYHGTPTVANRPPWDGGLIWSKDKKGNAWVSIACQGLGASVWYPCKDHQQDEPDSAALHITIPDTLVCVANGKLRGVTKPALGLATWNWAVTQPINNYTLIPYIGKYTHFNEVFKGEKGPLDMDYWVLDYNVDKAKQQFKDAPKMMKALEYWFGPYPFYEDGYKLVEAPHLGMEHQSAIAYGNKYLNGYLGSDLSGSGWGSKWDFIIIHESGHEWFANNITTKDIADMWVHEGFTSYSETLFTEFYYGPNAGQDYVIGTRRNISNDIPIIGPYNVNKEGSGDMYFKGANMIHTIRHWINNDSLFRQLLRGLNQQFYHQTITSEQVENYLIQKTKLPLQPLFDQYLRTTQIPTLEYKLSQNAISFRYTDCIDGFKLPLKINLGNEGHTDNWIEPTQQWQTLHLADWFDGKTFEVNRNFYIKTKKVE
jgi:aminopeptidase N